LRDGLLRACGRQCFGALSTSARAEAIAKAMARYKSTAWRSDCGKSAMPASYAGTAREFFYRLCLADAEVPKRRRLIDILSADAGVQSGRPFSLQADSPNVPTETRSKPDVIPPRAEGRRRRNAADRIYFRAAST
jgi:hypothetical protein